MVSENQKMTRGRIAERVREVNHIGIKQAEDIVNTVIDAIKDAVTNGEVVELRGFGTFRLVNQPARKSMLLGPDKPISIPASKRVSFRAHKSLRVSLAEYLNESDQSSGSEGAGATRAGQPAA